MTGVRSARAADLKLLYSAMNIPALADFRRVEFHRDKRDVLVVSSGAIALGRAVLKLPAGPLKLETRIGNFAHPLFSGLLRYRVTARRIRRYP